MNAGLGGTVAIIGTGMIKQVKVAECHDCFTITEIVSYEDLGFFEPGIHDQLVGRAGKMPVAGADMGLAHNLGGPGSVSAVAVLSQP
jgi:acetyl-CoA C-acetyltransferase